MSDLWPSCGGVGQVRSPLVHYTCTMWNAYFLTCVNSLRKKEETPGKKTGNEHSYVHRLFPSPVGFLIPQGQSSVFWGHPGTSPSFGFVRVLKDSEEVSCNKSSHRIWKDIEVSGNWIEGVREFLLRLLCLSVFFVFFLLPFFTIRHPLWLWRRHSLSRSDSWSRPSGGISICSYFCGSGERRGGNE